MKYLPPFIAFIIAFSACKKDDNTNPKPIIPSDTTSTSDTTITDTTTNNEGETNNLPTISGTINTTPSNNSIDLSTYIADADGDDVSIVSITGESNGTIELNGSNITYEPNSEYFIGSETLTVTINDGTDSNTGTITLNYTSPKGETYALISPYFGVTTNGDEVTNLKLESNGTLTSNRNVPFYGDVANSGTWTIKDNGDLEVTSEYGTVTDYTISPFTEGDRPTIQFDSNNQSMKVWVMN